MNNVFSFVFIMIFSLSSFVTIAASSPRSEKDITQFDYPLLLGQWEIEKMDLNKNILGLSMIFDSDYNYTMHIKEDGIIQETEKGIYSLNDNKLTLSTEGKESQDYYLEYNYRFLIMNALYFEKQVPKELQGEWKGVATTGENIKGIKNIDLTMTENFMFLLSIKGEDNKIKNQSGLYTLDRNNIIFYFEGGENTASYSIDGEKLKLNMEGGDLYAELVKI